MITPNPNQVLEQFTDRAQRIIGFARQEAQRMPGAEHFGADHILLAIVREGNSAAAEALKNASANYSNLQEDNPDKAPATAIRFVKGIPPTEAAQKAIDHAISEAKNSGDQYVSAEHLFLGLIHEADNPASQAILKFGLNLDSLRESVYKYAKTGLGDLGDPTGRFTDRAKKAMTLANSEGLRLRHTTLGSEHILLGLISVGSGVVAHVFKNLNIDLPRAYIELEKLVAPATAAEVFGKLSLTPRARKVIEYAKIESRDRGHDYLGTDHLLLGILQESDGMAASLLIAMGVTLAQVKEAVLKNIDQFPRDVTPSPPSSPSRELPRSIRRVLDLAATEARELGHAEIDPDDLLLALFLDWQSSGTQMLNRHGMNYYKVRKEIKRRWHQG